jgi:hypothetical protein
LAIDRINFLMRKVRQMPIRLKHDAEAETIGKLIDAGHPRLAFAAMCIKPVRTIIVTCLFGMLCVYAPDAMHELKSIAPTLIRH